MRYKILNLLKEKSDFISGQEIADSLNLSRTAVWKHISKLKEEGYNIKSVSNKGYFLESQKDILNESEIKYRPLEFVSEVDSTNNLAKTLANNNCKDGMLVVCDYQSMGKGRLGRSWLCGKGDSLCMSMVLRPDIMPNLAPQITLVAGIACCKSIRKITGLDCKIKWPNDIIVNCKKLVGILTEMSAEMERVKYVVVGIGVNVNNKNFDDEIKNKATSVFLETNKNYNRYEFANEIATTLISLYKIYCIYGFKPLCEEYNNLCINIGKKVKTLGKIQIEGISEGVNEKGELIIKTENGYENILSGEVSLRLSDNSYI
ncbi:MAG: biotin--[acetyl-CoA-carboxylase] ligase [Lachnospirales bacterium]